MPSVPVLPDLGRFDEVFASLTGLDSCRRWGHTDTTTPWYPSLRLDWQPSPGDWSTPVAGVAADPVAHAA